MIGHLRHEVGQKALGLQIQIRLGLRSVFV
jgi:hypothetical protein